MKPVKSNNSGNSGNFFRTNNQIKSPEIRLIGHDGAMIGIVSTEEGVRRAQEVGLDLVEISPNVKPPVCKIANVGKMKYEMQKKAADAKKKQKVVEVKEIKLSINIGKGDYEFKVKHTIEFIKKGHKVKVSIRMKGREITHADLARKMMSDVIRDVEEFAKPELGPRLEGMQMVMILVKK